VKIPNENNTQNNHNNNNIPASKTYNSESTFNFYANTITNPDNKTTNNNLTSPLLSNNTNSFANSSSNLNNCYEVWNGENNNYFLSIIKPGGVIEVFKIYENSFDIEKFLLISTDFSSIQSIFYSKYPKEIQEPVLNGIPTPNYYKSLTVFNKAKSAEGAQFACEADDSFNNSGVLFAVDSDGINIKAFKLNTKLKSFELLSCFYRGKSNVFISSIVLINKQTVAVASGNKTIHIFAFEVKSSESSAEQGALQEARGSISSSASSSKSYFGGLFAFIRNPYQLNKSVIKIRINDVSEKHEDSGIYASCFGKRGVVLFWDYESKMLKCLGYNGKVYYIKLDLLKSEYAFEKVYDWSSFVQRSGKTALSTKSLISEEFFEVLKDSLYTSSELSNNNINNSNQISENIIKESDDFGLDCNKNKNKINIFNSCIGERNNNNNNDDESVIRMNRNYVDECRLGNEDSDGIGILKVCKIAESVVCDYPARNKDTEKNLATSLNLHDRDSVLISIDEKNMYVDNVCFNKGNVLKNTATPSTDYDRWKII